MAKTIFSDGVEFDTSTREYHLQRRQDGWYVVGKGTLCPVISIVEGRQVIRELEELEALRNRLRSSKHLPHIGVQWALWGNGPKPKGATTQVHPAPQEEQHQAHRAAPTLPRWPERLPNKRSASSIAMRPKR